MMSQGRGKQGNTGFLNLILKQVWHQWHTVLPACINQDCSTNKYFTSQKNNCSLKRSPTRARQYTQKRTSSQFFCWYVVNVSLPQMTQHTMKVNITYPVWSHLARSYDHWFLVSCSPQKSRHSWLREALLEQTSCKIIRRCLVCGQFSLRRCVLVRDDYLCIHIMQGL